jgi:hypothetical protein
MNSTQALIMRGGIAWPWHRGQSGHPRPLPVTRTMLPTIIRRIVLIRAKIDSELKNERLVVTALIRDMVPADEMFISSSSQNSSRTDLDTLGATNLF